MTEGQQRGPGWFDVHEATRALERKWDCHFTFKLMPDPGAKVVRYGLSVVLEATKRDRTAWEKTLPGVWSSWPHVDHKTMPGLFLRLLHKFDEMMEERELERKKSQQPALPF